MFHCWLLWFHRVTAIAVFDAEQAVDSFFIDGTLDCRIVVGRHRAVRAVVQAECVASFV